MNSVAGGLDDLFPLTKHAPANGEVYHQVKQRLKRLAEIRTFIRNTKKDDDDLLYELPGFYSSLFQIADPDTPFRLDILSSADQVRRELQEGRSWLLRVITLQARHLPKENMIRILRFAIEKPTSEWTDIDRLYMTLTDQAQASAEDRLDHAYAIALHHRWASKYAHILNKLQEHESRRIRLQKKHRPQSTTANHEAVRARILEKVQSTRVDNFACAVPVASIINAPSDDERACPVCRNDYLDFAAFAIEDLVADYPVKIKYCGHILGKCCLETWMDTPLPDPAKYPHRTCPLCRTPIEFGGREDDDERRGIEPPDSLQAHVEDSGEAQALSDRLGLDDEDCIDALQRLASEEIVCEELLGQVEGRMVVDGEEQECLEKAKTLLNAKLKELREEKDMWGFSRNSRDWAVLKKQWADKMVKGLRTG